VLAALRFLTPAAALVALAAALPLVALVAVSRRSAKVAAAVGLRPEPRPPVLRALALAAACAVFGIAAAQPVLDRTTARHARSDAQAFVVVDVSRSMLAASGPEGATRLERARRIARSLRLEIPEVPTGAAGLTARVLPYVCPTGDERVFAAALAGSVAIEAPPPQQVRSVASTFAALPRLAAGGFFAPAARTRVCALLTDGESRPFAQGALTDALGSPRGCRLLVVRIGAPGERVYGADGRPEPEYRPDSGAAARVADLAAAVGGSAFSERDLPAAREELRRLVGTGPTDVVGQARRRTRLARYPALAGAVLVLLLVAPRVPPARRLRIRRRAA
jgi:hypothetical protein